MKYVSIQPFILQSESPSESDLDALGIYLLGSLSFVIGALIEFAFVIILNRIHTSRTKYEENEVEAKVDKQICNGVDDIWQQAWPRKRMAAALKPDAKPNKEEDMHNKKPNRARIFVLPSVNGVDFTAFWVYFFLYLLFNYAYWIRY